MYWTYLFDMYWVFFCFVIRVPVCFHSTTKFNCRTHPIWREAILSVQCFRHATIETETENKTKHNTNIRFHHSCQSFSNWDGYGFDSTIYVLIDSSLSHTKSLILDSKICIILDDGVKNGNEYRRFVACFGYYSRIETSLCLRRRISWRRRWDKCIKHWITVQHVPATLYSM